VASHSNLRAGDGVPHRPVRQRFDARVHGDILGFPGAVLVSIMIAPSRGDRAVAPDGALMCVRTLVAGWTTSATDDTSKDGPGARGMC